SKIARQLVAAKSTGTRRRICKPDEGNRDRDDDRANDGFNGVVLIHVLLRLPSFVVAGRRRSHSPACKASQWPPCARRPCEIGGMLFFPRLSLQRRYRGRILESVVQPAVPLGRHARCLDGTGIDNPAALAVLGLEVAVADIVGSNVVARKPSGHQRAERGSAPPDKDSPEVVEHWATDRGFGGGL